MHRFYSPPDRCAGATLTLEGAEAHHALHVLRLAVGEVVTVLDGVGHELLCEVAAAEKRLVTLAVRQRRDLAGPACAVTLCQAVTKTRSLELVVQKATELGVRRLVPVLCERSVPQIGAEAAPRKLERWRDIAIEGIKQCGSPWLPEISRPRPLKEILADGVRCELRLVGSLHPGATHPRLAIEAFRARHGRLPADAAIWIGPEGDFTPAEIAAICDAGAVPISLGPLVLRSETAAIYCLSFLSYELQTVQTASA
jgi:16S rRNA (uracil1498-N3)-methyltransferase